MKGFSRQLKQAMSEAEAVVNERKRIREALSKAEVDRIDKEAAVVEAQRKLGAEEADAALSGTPVKPGQARRRWRDARDDLEAVEARIGNLEERLGEGEERAQQAQADLMAPREELYREQISRYPEEYIEAAERFATVVRRGIGLRRGLGAGLHALESLRLLDPENGHRNVLDLIPSRHQGEDLVSYPDPMAQPEIKAAYDAVAQPRLLAKQLDQELAEIRKTTQDKTPPAEPMAGEAATPALPTLSDAQAQPTTVQ